MVHLTDVSLLHITTDLSGPMVHVYLSIAAKECTLMPQKATATQQSGELEQARVMLLSDAVEQFTNNELEDAIVIVIPDTGKGKFNGSHTIATGKQAGKDSKATFVIAELGSSFAGEAIEYRQSNGDVEGLPLSVKLSVIASPPNKAGTTVDQALNRKVELVEVPKTGTDN